MRIVEPTLAMFISELEKSEKLKDDVIHFANEYLKHKKQYGPQNWFTKNSREKLEQYLTQYKRQLSTIYDIMHDRGLSNFESGYIYPEDRKKFFPFTESASEWEEDDQLFIQLMNMNPLVSGGRQVGKSPIKQGRDRRTAISEANSGAASKREGSTDLQSSRVTDSADGGTPKEEIRDNPRESAEAYALAEYIL